MDNGGKILVAVIENTVYIKPIGPAVQDNCLGLRDFIRAMTRRGCQRVAFDLDQCTAMDSTFLGVIASAAMSNTHGRSKTVAILNADDEAKHELDMIGLLPVVMCREEEYDIPEEIELSEVDFVHLPQDERERMERTKELHEELIKLNEKNRKQWGAFVEMLEEELQRG